MQNQLAQHADLLSMTIADNHANLTIYLLSCARITLTGAKNASSLVKTARVRQSQCMYGCVLCQEARGDPVVLGNPAIALLGGAAGPANGSPSHPT